MAKHWETFEHTADIGLAGRADTLGELFEAMGEALAGLICSPQEIRPRETRSIAIHAEDGEALCVDFLVEVMTVIQTDHFLVGGVRVVEASERAVTAELAGEPYDPDRHELAHEVKAVTYHELTVAREADQWVARVIVDV